MKHCIILSLAAVCSAVCSGFESLAPGLIQDNVGRAGMIAALLAPNDHHATPVAVLAGGANFPNAAPNARTAAERGEKVFYDEVAVLPHVLNSAPEGEALKPLLVSKMPRPLGYAAFVGTPDGLVVAGGCNAEGHSAKVTRFELHGMDLRVEALPDLPRPVAYPAFALIGNMLYIIGGQEHADSTTCLSSCFALNLADLSAGWKELAPMPGGRMLAAAGVVNGFIYVVGGCSLHPDAQGQAERTYLSDVLCYDPGSNSWARVAGEMPESLVGMANPLPVYADKLFVVGGDPGVFYRASLVGQQPEQHPGQSKSVYSFTPATGEWRKEGELHQGVATLPAILADGVIYAISGETHPGVRTPVIEAFSVEK